MLIEGDCLEQLRGLEENIFDALVTDPPAGISFMGKEWDGDKGGRVEWINWMREVMEECLRVMKPGAHGLVWAIPRTSHWTATALELAGFEIRDVVTHLFGSGFPKSLDVSKAIDRSKGAEREAKPLTDCNGRVYHHKEQSMGEFNACKVRQNFPDAVTDLAKQWQGWGTALKPASEHWILIRKPLSEKTVASNVEKWGVGGLNIDACRIDSVVLESERRTSKPAPGIWNSGKEHPQKEGEQRHNPSGRFPANLLLSHDPECEDDWCTLFCAVRMLDEQSGVLKSGGGVKNPVGGVASLKKSSSHTASAAYLSDTGGASRFFYCAKASKKDRNAGLEGMPEIQRKITQGHGRGDINTSKKSDGGVRENKPCANFHPTVKSTKLMEYLAKLVTPPGGKILDPFMGSGSTGVAAKRLNFEFFGIEQNPEYLKIAEKRMEAVL